MRHGLRCDLTSKYLCRLVNYMDRKNLSRVLPTPDMSQVEYDRFWISHPAYGSKISRIAEARQHKAMGHVSKLYCRYFSDAFSTLQDGALKFTK